MKVTITPKKETSQAVLDIVVDAQEMQPFFEKAARNLSKEVQIKGFRPEKAPLATVAQHVGYDRLVQEAVSRAIPHFFVEAALDHKIDAITQPSVAISKVGMNEPLEFTATVDILPEVTLGDPKSVDIEKRDVTATDEQVEQELTYLARMRSNYIDVPRPAETGDTVHVDFSITVDGKEIEGGSSKNHPVTLGEGRFIPDFEKNITGMSAGEERQFSVKFPEDYGHTELQGKEAQASVKAHSVQKRVLPDINDEFARSLGQFTDLADLKTKLKDNIAEDQKAREKERYLSELAEKFAEKSTFSYIPESLIEKEIDNRIHEFAHMLAYQQKNLDQYLQEHDKTMEEMRNDMREAAQKHVKIGLTLRAFGKQHNIEVTDEEIEAEASNHLRQYKDVEEAKKHIDLEELKEHSESTVRNRKILEKLEELTESK